MSDVSEVTTRKGNESIAHKEKNCFVEEIKEVELRSRRGKQNLQSSRFK